MKKLNKKGFTLTEMIVVIAIIGVLAAVLIPSVVIYVQRAQQSNDEQLAASMTDEIERYCIENNLEFENLKGSDVRSILSVKNYDLEPSRKVYTYVYNTIDKKIEVIKLSDISDAIIIDQSNEPAEYRDGMYIVGKGNSKFEQCINDLYYADFENVNVDSLDDSSQVALINKYLRGTLYVLNDGVVAKDVSPNDSLNLVFCEMTMNIPAALVQYESQLEAFEVPEIIVTIDDDAKAALQNKILNMYSIRSDIYCNEISVSNFEFKNGKWTYTFGDLVEETVAQTFNVEILACTSLKKIEEKTEETEFTEVTNSIPELYYVVKATVRYYKLEGLVAEGTAYLLQEIDDSTSTLPAERFYGTELKNLDIINLDVCIDNKGDVEKDAKGKIKFYLNDSTDAKYIVEKANPSQENDEEQN